MAPEPRPYDTERSAAALVGHLRALSDEGRPQAAADLASAMSAKLREIGNGEAIDAIARGAREAGLPKPVIDALAPPGGDD